jgi:hypothetical protein
MRRRRKVGVLWFAYAMECRLAEAVFRSSSAPEIVLHVTRRNQGLAGR